MIVDQERRWLRARVASRRRREKMESCAGFGGVGFTFAVSQISRGLLKTKLWS